MRAPFIVAALAAALVTASCGLAREPESAAVAAPAGATSGPACRVWDEDMFWPARVPSPLQVRGRLVSGLQRPDSPRVRDLVPSPNHGDRRGKAIDALILHYTGMSTGAGALARLTEAGSGVSCHYLVWEDGRVTQLVAEAARAWHAGRSSWAGEDDMNSVSIGIEIVNAGRIGGCPPYPEAQIAAVAALAKDVCARNAIPAHRVLAHSDIAPDRKDDPGEWFPWAALAASGVGAFVRPGARAALPSPLELQRRLRAFGYACPETGVLDLDTTGVVAAFQRHYRPARVDGLVDAETIGVLQALIDLRPI